jgi:hypothetical protein
MNEGGNIDILLINLFQVYVEKHDSVVICHKVIFKQESKES